MTAVVRDRYNGLNRSESRKPTSSKVGRMNPPTSINPSGENLVAILDFEIFSGSNQGDMAAINMATMMTNTILIKYNRTIANIFSRVLNMVFFAGVGCLRNDHTSKMSCP